MALPLYLARTLAEMAGNPMGCGHFAYMACHFSPGGAGLSNCPPALPENALLILDDSTPMDGHDPEQILRELAQIIQTLGCTSLLLDFQRTDIPGQRELAELLSRTLPCPVAVSESYAKDLPCPVFLPPVPPDMPPGDYLKPWQGREIWLEAALEGITLTLTEQGCTAAPLWDFPNTGLAEDRLHCHYTVETAENSATFRLWRTHRDLTGLLTEAETLGVAKAIGLWQELGQ